MTVNVQKMCKFPKYRGGEEEDAMNNSFLMNLSIGLECLCCAVSVAAEELSSILTLMVLGIHNI